jgi:hypothetical protein
MHQKARTVRACESEKVRIHKCSGKRSDTHHVSYHASPHFEGIQTTEGNETLHSYKTAPQNLQSSFELSLSKPTRNLNLEDGKPVKKLRETH